MHGDKKVMEANWVIVGAISGSFGTRGEVRVKSFCTNPRDIEAYSPLNADNNKTYTLKVKKVTKDSLVANISGVTNKEDADSLKGLKLYANRDNFPNLLNDEFYYSDLIGLTALDPNSQKIGTVSAILNHGASDIIEIRTLKSDKFLLPFTKDSVPTIDLLKKVIIVNLPSEVGDKR